MSRFQQDIIKNDHDSVNLKISKYQQVENESKEVISSLDSLKKAALKNQYDKILKVTHQNQNRTDEIPIDNTAEQKNAINDSTVNCVVSLIEEFEKFEEPNIKKQTIKPIERRIGKEPEEKPEIQNESKTNVEPSINQIIPIDSDEKKNNFSIMKKLKDKSFSLNSELLSAKLTPKYHIERNKLEIVKTSKKLNQLASSTKVQKPKKIVIPGVNVNGTKLEFEKKFRLSSTTISKSLNNSSNKLNKIDISGNKVQNEKLVDGKNNINKKMSEKEKKRAVGIIKDALEKPPVQKKRGAIKSFYNDESNKKSSSNHEMTNNEQFISQTCISNQLEPFDASQFGNFKKIVSIKLNNVCM